MKKALTVMLIFLFGLDAIGQELAAEARIFSDGVLTQIEQLYSDTSQTGNFDILVIASSNNYLIQRSESVVSDTLIETIRTFKSIMQNRFGSYIDSLPKYDITYNSDPIRYRITDENNEFSTFPKYNMSRSEFYAMVDSTNMHYLDKLESYQIVPDSFQISYSVEFKTLNGLLMSRSDIDYFDLYGDTLRNKYLFAHNEQQVALSQFRQDLEHPFSQTIFDFGEGEYNLKTKQFSVSKGDSQVKSDTAITSFEHLGDTLFVEFPNNLGSMAVMCKPDYSFREDYILDLMCEQSFGSFLFQHLKGRVSPQALTILRPSYERDEIGRIIEIRTKGQPGTDIDGSRIEILYIEK